MTASKKLLVYKIVLFAFAFIIAVLPSTAVRNKEVNSRVIVELIGIDGGDRVSVTAQYVMPTEAQDSTGKNTVTAEGRTLSEAVEALDTALGRRAELGHCSMVVLGEDAPTELLGTLMTATDITADVYLVASDGKASELVGGITDFMKKTGATDADFIAYGAKKSQIATNTLLGFLSDLGSASESAFLPVIETPDAKSSGGSQSESGGGSGGGQSGQGGEGESGKPEENSGMKVEKLALYNASGRQGVLEKSAARGVAWVSAPMGNGVVTADVEYGGKTFKNVSGRLVKKRAGIKLDPKNKRAVAEITVTLEPNGDRFNELDIKSAAGIAAVKKGFAKAIEREVKAAYSDSLALGCDSLFVARQLYRRHPELFENGFSTRTLEFSVKAEVELK